MLVVIIIIFKKKLLAVALRRPSKNSRLFSLGDNILATIPEEELENINYSMVVDERHPSDIKRAKSYKHFKKLHDDRSKFFS